MTIIILKINNVRKANLVRRLRATQFVAQASSLEVNGGISIIVGYKKCRQRNIVSQIHGIFSARPALKICEKDIFLCPVTTGIFYGF